jgi:hypothetical protein
MIAMLTALHKNDIEELKIVSLFSAIGLLASLALTVAHERGVTAMALGSCAEDVMIDSSTVSGISPIPCAGDAQASPGESGPAFHLTHWMTPWAFAL